MSGIWYIVVPEAGTNYVLNPSAELPGNFGLLNIGSPSQSNSPSGSASPSSSASISPSRSVSPSGSQSNSPSGSASISPSASSSRSPSASASGSASPSPSPSAGIAAVTRSTTYARRGNYCYLIDSLAAYDGMTLDLATLTSAEHYVSFYLYDSVSGAVEVSLNGRAFYAPSVIGGTTGGWVRYGVTISASDASGSTRLYVRVLSAEDYYLDCFQVEPNNYSTSYIDGDMGPLYRWSGLRHGSASTRSAQARDGGREHNLLDDYGIEVVEGTKRIGTAPIIHNLQGQSLRPGAIYQSYKILPREIEWHVNYSASTWADFHAKRAELYSLLNPEGVSGAQPVVIGYAGRGTGKRVYASYYYNGGLEFGDFLAYDEVAPVKLLAPDPFWYEDNRETAALDIQDTLSSANYLSARIGGAWQSLGTGASGASSQVREILVDIRTGRIYVLGDFPNLGGVSNTADSGYWNGSAFVPLGTATAGSYIFGGILLPNGNPVVYGDFTSIGGVANTARIAMHNGTSWTAYGNANNSVYAAAIDPATGRLYVGGAFTNIGGSAISYVAYTTDGATYTAVGSPGGAVGFKALAWGPDGKLYAGINANTLKSWDGSTWTTLHSGPLVEHLSFAKNGRLYYASNDGVFSRLYEWNGSSATALISISNSTYGIDAVKPISDGSVLVSFSNSPTIDGITYGNTPALYNGSRLVPMDISVSATTQFFAFAETFAGDPLIGWYASSTSTATVSGITTVTNNSSVRVAPSFAFIGPSSGTCVLRWLENQSTGHRMYLNLTVSAGEIITIDCDAGTITSDWRGNITDNPLDASNFTTWRLLPGANTVAAFVTGTVTGAALVASWQPRHMSIDGAA